MELTSYLLGKKAGGGGGGGDPSDYFEKSITHNTTSNDNYHDPVVKIPAMTLDESVTDLSNCFYKCKASYIDVSLFDTTNITNMNSMFSGCSNLVEIDVSNFVIDNTDVANMFSNCSNLRKINMAGCKLSLSNAKSNYMFSNCTKVAILDISSFTWVGSSSSLTNLGIYCLKSDGAYADGIPYIYVKNESVQSSVIARNSNWSTANVIIKE